MVHGTGAVSNTAVHQRRQFIEALWSIVVSFVDLGFEVGPAEMACGQDAQSHALPRIDLSEVLELRSDLPEQFAQSSAAPQTRQEGVRND